ncbi:PH domain-containing protein [Shewanella gelidii]|uniref:YdbS-like PH domain-containing protein n=1 Tax=Shewanella gelidii TaxID=1642821 RepID=A0A917JMJ0_9GAMM|nr:PH domain-containing protein [Shewanella gelidii]MCL1099291.1 PH domain-containing protein [Shewanella gelidii]GGI77651.1 hypothetical protein GCM10009332_13780 [Shewanella gelidii]
MTSDNQRPPQRNEQATAQVDHTILSTRQWQGFDQVQLTPVDPRYSSALALEHLFLAIVVLTIATLVTMVILGLPTMLVLSIVSGLFIMLIITGFVRQAQSKRLAFGVCQHELLLQKGIIWQQRISLPYTRLQHVSLSQGPIERRFQLSTLKCFSAGSGSAEIDLPGLEKSQAEQLRQHLLTQAGLVADNVDTESEGITDGQ